MRAEEPTPPLEDADETGPTDPSGYLAPGNSEAAYDRLTAYGFARRYVGGKAVADISPEGADHASRLLAQTAASVTVLTESAEAPPPTARPAPNVSHERVRLPKLDHPEGHFDVVVAFGVIDGLAEQETLVEEARRVLKGDGVFVVSVPDRRASVADHVDGESDHRRGMYASELRELLERSFGRVHLYRQGAVVGGMVIPESGETAGVSPESAPFSLLDPQPDAGPPATRTVLAVCGDAETLASEQPYLLLDRDRRVFDEREDLAEDVGLLRDEVGRMQETEAQSFHDALKLHRSEIAYLRAQVRRLDPQKVHLKNLQDRINAMENSAAWRLFEPYRRLRAGIDGLRGRPRAGKSSGDGPG